MKVRVTSPLGAPGTPWQLEVRDGNGKTSTVSGLRPLSPDWRALNYVGYISDAAVASTACLADISVTNTNTAARR